MKQLAPLLLAATVAAAPAFADSFDDAVSSMDQAFEQQDQMFATEVRKQDQAYKAYVEEIDRAWKRYNAEIEAVWGGDNKKTPSKKEWVSYSDKRDERSSIDFEKGKVQVDVLLQPGESPESSQVKARIKNQLEKLITQPAREDKALQVAPPVDSAAIASPSPVYPLAGQLKLPNGKTVSRINAAQFAEDAVKAKRLKSKTIQTPQGDKQLVSVTVELVPDHLERRAGPYLKRVREMAQRFDIPVSLIFGIMQTESFFNPMARSQVPAFGLMQLVPKSGGRDAYEYVFKDDKVVSSDYLYTPDNNIELGSAYLKLLQIREMRRINNPKSRMLCAIAAYNTGGGNVAKAFVPGSRNIKKASAIINTMTPEQVYNQLRARLPYEETRNYVKRVWSRMDNYKGWDL